MLKEDIQKHMTLWLSGKEESFNKLIKHYYKILIPSCMRFISKREDTEELVMNVLLKVWQNKARFQEVNNMDSYVYAMLRQEITAFSRKKVLEMISLEDINPVVANSTDHFDLSYKELLKHYQTAIEKLSPKQRKIYLMIREKGYSRNEIAEITGLSVNTINNHMNTALRLLRKELKEYPDLFVLYLTISSSSITYIA
ncbi:RNA polymerase sigma factor [Sphingobacterium lactis]|uniref:RNA polymerase sigma factor n=1 Tax=Sphingobacterium lactis TaxID=797291 RepID=UPI003F7ED900